MNFFNIQVNARNKLLNIPVNAPSISSAFYNFFTSTVYNLIKFLMFRAVIILLDISISVLEKKWKLWTSKYHIFTPFLLQKLTFRWILNEQMGNYGISIFGCEIMRWYYLYFEHLTYSFVFLLFLNFRSVLSVYCSEQIIELFHFPGQFIITQ